MAEQGATPLAVAAGGGYALPMIYGIVYRESSTLEEIQYSWYEVRQVSYSRAHVGVWADKVYPFLLAECRAQRSYRPLSPAFFEPDAPALFAVKTVHVGGVLTHVLHVAAPTPLLRVASLGTQYDALRVVPDNKGGGLYFRLDAEAWKLLIGVVARQQMDVAGGDTYPEAAALPWMRGCAPTAGAGLGAGSVAGAGLDPVTLQSRALAFMRAEGGNPQAQLYPRSFKQVSGRKAFVNFQNAHFCTKINSKHAKNNTSVTVYLATGKMYLSCFKCTAATGASDAPPSDSKK